MSRLYYGGGEFARRIAARRRAAAARKATEREAELEVERGPEQSARVPGVLEVLPLTTQQLHVFPFLDARDLGAAATSCMRWQETADQERYWESLLRFKGYDITNPNGSSTQKQNRSRNRSASNGRRKRTVSNEVLAGRSLEETFAGSAKVGTWAGCRTVALHNILRWLKSYDLNVGSVRNIVDRRR